VHAAGVALAAIAVASVVAPAAARDPVPAVRLEASRRLSAAVVEALGREPRVRVMVAFVTEGRADEAPGRGRRRIAEVADAIMAAGAHDFAVRRRFASVRALAGEATAAGVARLLARSEVRRVDLDVSGTHAMTQSLPIVKLPDVKALGFTGQGVTVAVIDSGVDRDHADLADSLVGEACFCGGGCCPGGGTTADGPGAAEDDNGHGTNVAGIVTSNGGVAPEGGAPDAAVVAVKVLDATGGFCCASDVVAAMDWVLAEHPETAVVNLSLGTHMLFEGDCDGETAFTMALADAVNALRANGTLSVVATGNQGQAALVAAPACVANAVAVGATWDAALGSQSPFGFCSDDSSVDLPTCFTNSGAVVDLYAPGAYVVSTGLGGGTSSYAGTSQAAPTVAACAAAIRQADASLSPDAIEAALEGSPAIVVDPKNALVFPRLDCLASLQHAAGTTTTTLPGCVAEPTFPSLACRMGALASAIDTSAELGRMQAKLATRCAAASARLAEAATADDARRARKALRAAGRRICAVGRKLASRRAERSVPDGTRLPLLAASNSLCADVAALRAAL